MRRRFGFSGRMYVVSCVRLGIVCLKNKIWRYYFARFCLLCAYKPNSVPIRLGRIGDNYLSGPKITLGLERHFPWFLSGHGLALSKDLAVSSPLFCPYSGAGPTSLGSGPSFGFRLRTLLFAPRPPKIEYLGGDGYYPLPFPIRQRADWRVFGLSSPPRRGSYPAQSLSYYKTINNLVSILLNNWF